MILKYDRPHFSCLIYSHLAIRQKKIRKNMAQSYSHRALHKDLQLEYKIQIYIFMVKCGTESSHWIFLLNFA